MKTKKRIEKCEELNDIYDQIQEFLDDTPLPHRKTLQLEYALSYIDPVIDYLEEKSNKSR